MGLLDNLWGEMRNADSGQESALPRLVMSALGGGDSQAQQAQGLGNLVQKFQQAGLGNLVQSWVSNQQQNQPVSPDQVHAALGEEHVGQLAQTTGMGKGALLAMLATTLPKLIDAMTPNGQVPHAPDTASLERAAGPPNQVPGEAEAPRAGGFAGLRQAVEGSDDTEPTPSANS